MLESDIQSIHETISADEFIICPELYICNREEITYIMNYEIIEKDEKTTTVKILFISAFLENKKLITSKKYIDSIYNSEFDLHQLLINDFFRFIEFGFSQNFS